ncbi:MAG TPA: DUF4139 domain-containing protein [bacterium]|jgi:hypothetical protein
MRVLLVFAALSLSLALAAWAQPGVTLTIYNKDLMAVRETRPIELSRGVSEYRYTDVAARIDATSVTFTAPGVELLEQNFDFDLLSTEQLLKKFSGKEVEVVTDKGEVLRGDLMTSSSGGDSYYSSRQVILRLPDKSLRTFDSQHIAGMHYPTLPDGVIMTPTLRWRVNAESGGTKQAEIAYLTKGISWRADYSMVLSEESDAVLLGAWVTIDNKCGASYRDAKLKLLAGDVHHADDKVAAAMAVAYKAAAPSTEQPFEEHGLFEYHMYTLERPANVLDKETKQIELFKPTHAKATRIYEYNPQRKEDRVGVMMEFENNQANGLGMALPGGLVRVYQNDKDGAREFLGDDRIDHTPKNEKVRVRVGEAFDITVAREAKDRRRQPNNSVDTDWEVRLRNHKSQVVTVDVLDHIVGIWNLVRSNYHFEKNDAQTIEASVLCEPEREVIITYTVHTGP